MKDTRELQEEFELLIEELGRLKSINDITTENSDNSKRTIDAIESLVSAMDAFKKRVESDYKEKSEELLNLQKSFKDVIDSLQSNIGEQTARFESLVVNFTELSYKSNKEFQSKTNQKLDAFIGQSVSAFDKQQLSFNKSINEIATELSKVNIIIDTDITKLRQEHQSSGKEIEQQLNFLSFQLNIVHNKNRVLTILVIVTLVLVALCVGLSFVL